ncbi:MAG TPA: hypothetical protein VFT22_32140 [Kofleriaceae bacterium]|nr:hypothetical protein [Kofleriaceae bacterium]
MAIEGKDALALHARLKERNAKLRAERLTAARAEAEARGKQAFDLETLERMVDTSSEGRLAPVEERRERFEYMYYVDNPSLMTLAELAALIRELASW